MAHLYSWPTCGFSEPQVVYLCLFTRQMKGWRITEKYTVQDANIINTSEQDGSKFFLIWLIAWFQCLQAALNGNGKFSAQLSKETNFCAIMMDLCGLYWKDLWAMLILSASIESACLFKLFKPVHSGLSSVFQMIMSLHFMTDFSFQCHNTHGFLLLWHHFVFLSYVHLVAPLLVAL
jgi:hypothetical protein